MGEYPGFRPEEAKPKETKETLDPNEAARRFLELLQNPQSALAITPELRQQLAQALAATTKLSEERRIKSAEEIETDESVKGVWEKFGNENELTKPAEYREQVEALVKSLLKTADLIYFNTKVHRARLDYITFPLINKKDVDAAVLSKGTLNTLSPELQSLSPKDPNDAGATKIIEVFPYPGDTDKVIVSMPFASSAYDADGRPTGIVNLAAVLKTEDPGFQAMLKGDLQPSVFGRALFLTGALQAKESSIPKYALRHLSRMNAPQNGMVVDMRTNKLTDYSRSTPETYESAKNLADKLQALKIYQAKPRTYIGGLLQPRHTSLTEATSKAAYYEQEYEVTQKNKK